MMSDPNDADANFSGKFNVPGMFGNLFGGTDWTWQSSGVNNSADGKSAGATPEVLNLTTGGSSYKIEYSETDLPTVSILQAPRQGRASEYREVGPSAAKRIMSEHNGEINKALQGFRGALENLRVQQAAATPKPAAKEDTKPGTEETSKTGIKTGTKEDPKPGAKEASKPEVAANSTEPAPDRSSPGLREVSFGRGSARLSRQALKIIGASVAAAVSIAGTDKHSHAAPTEVHVKGMADSTTYRHNSDAKNMDLANRRAEAVQKAIEAALEKKGAKSQFTVVTDPCDSSTAKTCTNQNKRAAQFTIGSP